jgi:hypothetical protein
MCPAEKGDEDPVPSSERPTRPDISPLRIKASRAKIERTTQISRRQEVMDKICEVDSLRPEKVKNVRMFSIKGRDTLIEHRCHETGNTYLYVTKEHPKVPDFYSFDRSLTCLSRHPGATVLLRINWFEEVTEIHRWDD